MIPDRRSTCVSGSPSADTLAFLESQSRRLESATAEEILAWAIDSYFPRFTMATGLGPEGCVIISMLAKIEPRVYVFNLDTGYQFAETLALRERIMDKYAMSIHLERPEQTVAEYEAANDGPVYRAIRIAAVAIGRSACSNAWRHGSTPGPPAFAATRARRGPTRRSCSGTRSLAW